jgi:hypothetical protein
MKSMNQVGGFDKYLDTFYSPAGGSKRFKFMYDNGWPKAAMAREFGISRQQMNGWFKRYEVEHGLEAR